MLVVGSTFGGVIIFEIKGDFCRVKVMINVQKPLRRGIFIGTCPNEQSWVPFNYENLPGFCFGCGRLGHNLINCAKSRGGERITRK